MLSQDIFFILLLLSFIVIIIANELLNDKCYQAFILKYY